MTILMKCAAPSASVSALGFGFGFGLGPLIEDVVVERVNRHCQNKSQ